MSRIEDTLRRFVGPARNAISGGGSPRERRIRSGVGLVLFLVILVVSWWSVRDDFTGLRWGWIGLLVAVGTPAMTLVLGAEQRVSAKMVGSTQTFLPALSTAIVASAANLLPIPGSILVRSEALRSSGAAGRQAYGASAGLALLWLSVTAVPAGVGLAVAGRPWIGWAVVAGSVAATVAFSVALRRSAGGDPSAVLLAVVLIIGKVLLRVVNTAIGLLAVGATVTLGESAIIASSAALSSAAGVFPGGLGLRELLSGLLASLTTIPPAVAVLGAVVNRIAMLVSLGGTWVVVNALLNRQSRSQTPD